MARKQTHVYIHDYVTNSPLREISIQELNDFLSANNAQISFEEKFYDKFEHLPEVHYSGLYGHRRLYIRNVVVVPRGIKCKGALGQYLSNPLNLI